MPILFAVTLFVSASLLFMVQPMVAKMILPLLGGSPAVWNACMVFFQALLLLGYLYAHRLTQRLSPARQWPIHLSVVALPFVSFALAIAFGSRHTPIAIVESLAPTGDANPVLHVLALLAIAIGIPFFVISTSAPLLQRWFAYTGHPSARDPYFLYSASNAGSMISLLGYPLLIEPNLSINGQAWLFAIGFSLLAALVYLCGHAATHPVSVAPPKPFGPASKRRNGTEIRSSAAEALAAAAETADPPPTLLRRLRWIALAFVPSSLMLGVTFHMSTDIASIPLMWVIPLALYLLTFIIAFGRVPTWFRLVIGNLAPVLILLLVFTMVSKVVSGQMGLEMFLHIVAFFAVALMCHYELAYDRPSTHYLTEFYLLMSVGGMLGGIFNAIVAPLVFTHAFEYPLVLILACLLVPPMAQMTVPRQTESVPASPGVGTLTGSTQPQKRSWKWWLNWGLDLLVPALVYIAFDFIYKLPGSDWYAAEILNGSESGGSDTFCRIVNSLSENLNLAPQTIISILIFAVPVMVCFFFVDRPLRFALSVAAILLPMKYRDSVIGYVHVERSFFGILKVEQRGTFNRLIHGTTLHGTQFNEHFVRHWRDDLQFMIPNSPWDVIVIAGANWHYDVRQEPLTYYHRTGPVGAAFRELRTRKGGADAKAPVAMVGLGTGSVSCYALPGQKLVFYEIDPAVQRLVADSDRYFTYVRDARQRGADIIIRLGDARLKLKEDSDARYALLFVDAFSSDAIPVHLLTREAVQLYMDRLTDDGILALHISNKYVALEPVVAAIARDLGLEARIWNDSSERHIGKTASSWVMLARRLQDLGTLALPEEEQQKYGTDFRPLRPLKNMEAWTDDYADVLRVMMLDEVRRLRRLFGLPTYRDDD
ncbi:MAG: fused MFS/spermidine synthase [Gemmataceae bacterium]|nr:fused MFS/spermidine synthase [Gemmataceae bacterium]